MNTLQRNNINITVGLAVLLVIIPTCAQQPSKPSKAEEVLAQQPSKPSKAEEAFRMREMAMQELAGDSEKIAGSLKTLSAEQRSAVVALMAITRAAAAYESRFMRKDDASLRTFYGTFSRFSPAYKAPGKFQSLLAGCFDATVSCLSAQKKCLDDGNKVYECERDPKVVEPCANEAICFTNEFFKLHKGIPDILGGRDPWPPQPFPY
ncbi:MAG TPA: hypothetical protein VFY83_06250 [Anaerolineales bacterium]|nr:hypothetical protein [Anaerolineales bacterium]